MKKIEIAKGARRQSALSVPLDVLVMKTTAFRPATAFVAMLSPR